MFDPIPLSKTAQKCSTLLILAMSLSISNAYAENDMIGADEFLASCASCHGVSGKGDGPIAEFLTPKPTDLTQLAKNNHGLYPSLGSGTYPFQRVFQVIDGRTLVSGHGDRAMPVWGSRYKMEEGEKYGPMGAEKVIRGRVLELVYYIQTIQEE
ncbi:cytochrome c [Neptunomonas sp.]|uniref:c-type cytochrome n=1 Tax=Neptunomonas sp. TaxID=1971898 RepID=UPI00356A29ED